MWNISTLPHFREWTYTGRSQPGPPPSQSTFKLDEHNAQEEGASPTLVQSPHDEHLDRSFTRRLPTELLGYIFILTLPDYEYIQPNIRSSPLVLGRVCNAWRATAHATPQLWSSLCAYYRRHDEQKRMVGIDTWLSRSRVLPLDIRVMVGVETTQASTEFPLAFSPHFHRCRKLSLMLQRHWILGFLANSNLPLTALENLELDLCNEDSPLHMPTFSISSSAPQLRRLSLMGNFPNNCDLGYSQLTHLITGPYRLISNGPNLSITHYITILRLCPQLMHCSIGDIYLGPDGTPLMHHNLRSLVLYSWRSEFVESMLDLLTLPALRDIRIVLGPLAHPQTWSTSTFESFLCRSLCPLESFTLVSSHDTPEEIIHAVLSVPSLVQVALWKGGQDVTPSYILQRVADRKAQL
jgi:hypothetical protein